MMNITTTWLSSWQTCAMKHYFPCQSNSVNFLQGTWSQLACWVDHRFLLWATSCTATRSSCLDIWWAAMTFCSVSNIQSLVFCFNTFITPSPTTVFVSSDIKLSDGADTCMVSTDANNYTLILLFFSSVKSVSSWSLDQPPAWCLYKAQILPMCHKVDKSMFLGQW